MQQLLSNKSPIGTGLLNNSSKKIIGKSELIKMMLETNERSNTERGLEKHPYKNISKPAGASQSP